MKITSKIIAFLTAAVMLFAAIPASAARTDYTEQAAAPGSGFTLQSYKDLGLQGLNGITKEDLAQYANSVLSSSEKETASKGPYLSLIHI